MPKGLDSARRLQGFDIQTVVSYHGGVLTGEDIHRQLQEIANR